MDTAPFEQHESAIRGYCRAYPTVFASASNAHQVAEDGTRYIDFSGGAGSLNYGHNNPRMKQAMIEWWGPVIHEYYASTEAAGSAPLSEAATKNATDALGQIKTD